MHRTWSSVRVWVLGVALGMRGLLSASLSAYGRCISQALHRSHC